MARESETSAAGKRSLDACVSGYIDRMLFYTIDMANDEALVELVGPEDLSPAARCEIRKDCAAFLGAHRDDIPEEMAGLAGAEFWEVRHGWAHDTEFTWLPEEFCTDDDFLHGWPRQVAERLTEYARRMETTEAFIGADGRGHLRR